ncbi:MAG: nucleotidyltransferase domain-containing protein [Anaerolineae bacterium]|nr:nucleotidyltransferase domain-containing protein [Anaerolineae bacterium]
MSVQTEPIQTLDDVRARRDEILDMMAQYRILNVRVFGSIARGDATPGSDIDFLVEYPAEFTLLDLSEVTLRLKDLLGRKVHLADGNHLREELRSTILDEAKPL